MKIVGFWEKFNQEWDEINRGILIVQGDASLLGGISAYKLYVNGNIYKTGTRFSHLAPPNSIYMRFKAGVYRIVLREHNVKKLNRIESNTLHVEIQEDKQMTIQASLRQGKLILSF